MALKLDSNSILLGLGIKPELIYRRGLLKYKEPSNLELAEISQDGREHMLTREASSAWISMKTAARSDGETLFLVSAFRSVTRQAEIIQNKLDAGQNINDILKVSAPPGYSEHHTGCALDLSTNNVECLSEEFEHTSAFKWLVANAEKFSFSLSYPKENLSGYDYEPWHWRYDIN